MRTRRRTGARVWLVVAGGAIALGLLVPRFFGDQRSGTERLVNQAWIERMPGDQRDMVGFLHFLEHDGKRFGGVGRASQWRFRGDGFVWALDGDVLRARFPQDGRNARVQVRTWRCAGEAPRPFEWCLELRSGDRARRFYSRDDWRIRPHEGALDDSDARAELSWLLPALHAPVASDEAVGDTAEPPAEPTPFDEAP